MTDRIEVCIVRSGGKNCLSIGDRIVGGPWTGQGQTVSTFKVRIDEIEEIIANHKAHKAREETISHE
jgi:hypothetical protein